MLSFVNILVGGLCCAWAGYSVSRGDRSLWVKFVGGMGLAFIVYGTLSAF